jgi:hypothetical protein
MPPKPPKIPIGIKQIVISGKKIPPPPRKVIIERLAPLPNKPRPVIIERWLPYQEQSRKVILNKRQSVNNESNKNSNTRNLIVQWEAPQAVVKQQIQYLGVIRADPIEYTKKYAGFLKEAKDLPVFVTKIKTPSSVGGCLAADLKNNSYVPKLVGELDALKYIDLDKEGLSEYKEQLTFKIIKSENKLDELNNNLSSDEIDDSEYSMNSESSENLYFLSEILNQLDEHGNDFISRDKAQAIFIKINNRLGMHYSKAEVDTFFKRLDKFRTNRIDIKKFKNAFNKLL